MKFVLSSTTVLLAFAASSFLDVVFAQEEETCGTRDYDLFVRDNEKFGSFEVTDDEGHMLDIKIDITGYDLTPGTVVNTYLTDAQYQVCCDTEPKSNCSEWMTISVDDEATMVMTTIVEPPMCGEGVATDVDVKVTVTEPGGVGALVGLFPVEGQPTEVDFSVTDNSGSNADNSYFKTSVTIKNGDGTTYDFIGYCVDRGNTIIPDKTYSAKAYNFLEVDWSNSATNSIGNIDKPENMPAVAWCINNWNVGKSYENYGVLSSSTLQLALWKIVDDNHDNSGSGLTQPNAEFADHIAANCMASGSSFKPRCDHTVPIIIVPDDPQRQNQYVQTQLSQLKIQCIDEVANGEAEAYCVNSGSSGSGGDPHFKTFGGKWFDFHGGCDLLLADFPNFANGLGLMVEIRTKVRYDYSYIEAAAIKIGDDILEVFSYGQYLISGVSNADMPAMIGGFPVERSEPKKNQVRFTIDLGDSRNIGIKVYKDLVYVDLNVHHGHSEEFKRGVGMLGAWNNGARLARDGVTILSDDNEYGQEWQIRDTEANLFVTDSAPQWPAKCEMPNLVERASRRLGEAVVSSEAATAACAHIKDQHSHDMCVFDVIATADLSVAQGGVY